MNHLTQWSPHPNNKYVNQKNLYILWSLGDKCNYQCSYCPPQLHLGRWGWQNLEDSRRFIKKVHNHAIQSQKNLVFSFSGGEPFLNQNLENICSTIKKLHRNHKVIVLSNGVFTLKKKLCNIDSIILSFHIESANKKQFILMAKELLKNEKLLEIHLNAHPNYWQEIIDFYKLLKSLNLPVILKPLTLDFKNPLTKNYTIEQKGFILEESIFYHEKTTKDQPNSPNEMYSPLELIITRKNSWKNWNCFIGIDMLEININGDIRRGPCNVGGVIGHISEESFFFPEKPIKCDKNFCGCIPAICTRKSNEV